MNPPDEEARGIKNSADIPILQKGYFQSTGAKHLSRRDMSVNIENIFTIVLTRTTTRLDRSQDRETYTLEPSRKTRIGHDTKNPRSGAVIEGMASTWGVQAAQVFGVVNTWAEH